MPLKPVEHRTLRAPTSSAPQGKLKLWVDIFSAEDAKKYPLINIQPPPPVEYELRVIIWGCKEVTIKDTLTDANDLYITGAIDTPGVPIQSTDTHLRSHNGKGNFNWRMKFPIKLPTKHYPRFRLQVWDLDFFSPDDSICEAYFSLKGLCRKSQKENKRCKLFQGSNDRITIENLKHPNFEGNQGIVQISMELMPMSIAAQIPAGMGREAPNTNPHLPEPEGRIKFSLLHPLDFLRDCLGDNFCNKLILLIFLSALGSALYFLAPMIMSQLVANSVTGK